MKGREDGGEGAENKSMSATEWSSVANPKSESETPQQKPGLASDAQTKVPETLQAGLAAVAASILHSASGMSRWGAAESTLGLYKLYRRHVKESAMDTINGTPVTSVPELQELGHWIKWASAAYQETIDACARELEVPTDSVIQLVETSTIGQPAYVIGLDHPHKAVVLSIRGTFSALDVLTDLTPHSENYGDGYAHSGMLKSARWLKDKASDVLKDQTAIHEGYQLVVTGHSLGAGTAALVTLLLREANEQGLTVIGTSPEKVTCWGYCCPPCVDQILAKEATFISCVIHQDDIVARISPAAIEDLRAEIVQTDWTQAFEDGTQKQWMIELAQRSQSMVDRIEPALNLEKGELLANVKQKGLASWKDWTGDLAQRWTKAAEGAYGPRAKQATSFLTTGTVAAGTGLSAMGKQVVESMNEAVARETELIKNANEGKDVALPDLSAGIAAEAQALTEGNDSLVRTRLFVPGILYHVIRKPLKATKQSSDEVASAVDTSTKGKNQTPTPLYEHIVCRGNDPSSRFRRIVLSPSFISDHLCGGLQEALADALKGQGSESTFES